MQTIILLHGALGSATELQPLATALAAHGLQTHAFSFSGHAKNAFAPEFGIPQFTGELAAFMEQSKIEKAHLFGYSMGGYVALNLALAPNSRVDKIVTLATKFNWSAEAVEKETAALNPELMLEKVPAFAVALEEKHGPAWKELVLKTAGLMRELSRLDLLNAASLKTILNPVLLGLGDRDKMVSLEETTGAYKSLANGAMYMLPGTKHPLETANIPLLSQIIAGFLQPH